MSSPLELAVNMNARGAAAVAVPAACTASVPRLQFPGSWTAKHSLGSQGLHDRAFENSLPDNSHLICQTNKLNYLTDRVNKLADTLSVEARRSTWPGTLARVGQVACSGARAQARAQTCAQARAK